MNLSIDNKNVGFAHSQSHSLQQSVQYAEGAIVSKIITKKDKPKDVANFYSRDSLFEIVANARKICGDAPLACNVLYAINDYGRVVRDACEAGVNIIITGAGIPTNMPEFTKDFPD
ncbi:MAG TPA: nitronate monooxygenase, partial [Bacteroidales bacterium]|nr:nitronate monooxygenase [Bacteroidales bacterium]